MKRLFIFCACALLALGFAMSLASANSWGLQGELLNAVAAVDTWNDYSTLTGQVGDIALMRSRYHNVLMLLGPADQTLHVYSKAVYQPGDSRGAEPKLQKTEDGFTLSYGDTQRYIFYQNGDIYELKTAVIGDFSVTLTQDSPDNRYYLASDGKQSARLWRRDLPLNIFNVSLFPRSVAAVRQTNYMRAALDSGQKCLGWSSYPDEMGYSGHYANIGTGTQPVYSAPFGEDAWRSANGKAAVGLNGDIWTLKGLLAPDGSAWVCIRYNVSQRTQRIGYIPASVLGVTISDDPQNRDLLDRFISVDVIAAQDTYLTDDPDVSQYPQLSVPRGTTFTCMGMYGNDYAYVAAEVNNGRFGNGGKIVWGFVPLQALAFPDTDPYRALQTDVMANMTGEWVFAAGGSMADEKLIFHADGTFTGQMFDFAPDDLVPERHGTWFVTKYNPVWNLYWDEVPYELTLFYDSGRANVKGLKFTDPWMSLLYYEGSGGYVRPEDLENLEWQ